MQHNPYTVPTADLGDAAQAAAPLTVQQMLFSFEGRIRRGQYWTYILACSALGAIAGMTLMFLLNAVLGREAALNLTMLVMGAMYLAFLWMGAALQAKRWHDRDKSAWWILLAFVPIVNIWVAIELGFLPGTPGRNSFGPPPA